MKSKGILSLVVLLWLLVGHLINQLKGGDNMTPQIMVVVVVGGLVMCWVSKFLV